MITHKVLIDIAEELIGQCTKDIEDCCSERGIEFIELTDEDFLVIDDIVFLCDVCGWWCEVSERVEDDDVCENCAVT